MKRNAMIRIVIWSLVIVVLSTVMISVMTGWSLRGRRYRTETPAATHVPQPLETVDVQQLPAAEGKTVFSANEISELEIEWVAGEILIQPGSTDQITVREDGVTDPQYTMVLQHRGEKLKILFCEENITKAWGISIQGNISKDLTILVPRDWFCQSLDIDCASATVEINDLTIGEVDFDGASGTCEFENCTVDEIDIDTASGDIRFIGELNMLDCDAASASVYASLSNTPSRLDMDSMSGDLEIILPQDAGFTLSMDGLSTDFTSDFETTVHNGNYVCGDGRCRINLDALSGDVTIRKNATP